MPASSHAIPRLRSALGFTAIAALLTAACAGAPPVQAQGTHLWTQSQLEEFEKGTSQGVALQSDGHLREGPGLTEILTTPSTFVWSVAVLRLGSRKGEKPFTLFETKDLNVQVVRMGPDGYLYAATLPSGKVYRLKPDAAARQDDASATLVFDAAREGGTGSGQDKAGTHYIWDLTFDSAGRLYIATGDPAAVYRVDPSKPGTSPQLFFKSDEAHIRSRF